MMQAWRRHLHRHSSYRDSTPFWPLCSGICPDYAALGLSQSSPGGAQRRDAQFARGIVYPKRQRCSTVDGQQRPTSGAEDGRRPHGHPASTVAESPTLACLQSSLVDAMRRLDGGRDGGGSDWTCILRWVSSRWLERLSGWGISSSDARLPSPRDGRRCVCASPPQAQQSWYFAASEARMPWSSPVQSLRSVARAIVRRCCRCCHSPCPSITLNPALPPLMIRSAPSFLWSTTFTRCIVVLDLYGSHLSI